MFSSNRSLVARLLSLSQRGYATESVALGSEVPPQAGASVSKFLETLTAIYPDKDVLRFCHQYSSDDQSLRWTWKELGVHSDALAVGLGECRVRFGDSVVLQMPNESENLVSVLAAGKWGARAVQVSQDADLPAVRAALVASKARSVIFSPANQDESVDRVAAFRQLVPELQDWDWGEALRSCSFPDLKTLIQIGPESHRGFLSFRDIFVSDPWPSPLPKVAARLQDGSQPLLCRLHGESLLDFSQASVLASASATAQRLGLSSADRVLSALPLDQPLGQTALFAVLASRGLMIVASAVDDAKQLLAALRTEEASALLIGPSSLASLLAQPLSEPARRPLHLRKLLVVASPSDPLSPALLAQARAAFPEAAVSTGYAHPAVPGLLLQSPGDAAASASAPLSFGAPLPNVTAKVVDTAGKPVTRGSQGTLYIQGPGVAASLQSSGFNTHLPATMHSDGSISVSSP